MKSVKKTLAGLILIVALVFTIPVVALAAPTIDQTRSGDITVSMLSPGREEPIAGVKIEVFYVGTIDYTGNILSFEPAGAFAASGVTFTDLTASTSKSTAKTLADYAKVNGINSVAHGTTGSDGKLQFNALQLGLYLMVVDFESGSLYIRPAPFLVGVPATNAQGTAWEYTVHVLPKIEEEPVTTTGTTTPGTTAPGTTTPGITSPATTTRATPTPGTTVPGTTTLATTMLGTTTPGVTAQQANESELTTENTGTLPQTGQLRWPIPILSVAGIILFSLGWADIYLKRKKKHE